MMCYGCGNWGAYIENAPSQDCHNCGNPLDFTALELFSSPETRLLPGVRDQQVEMGEFIDERLMSFMGAWVEAGRKPDLKKRASESTIMVIQAPTGVGKTYGYLLPVLAKPNLRVIVATATKNLQTQIEESIAKLAAGWQTKLGRSFEHSVLKGGSNYVCISRIQELADHARISDGDASFIFSQVDRNLRMGGWGETQSLDLSSRPKLAKFVYPLSCSRKSCEDEGIDCGYVRAVKSALDLETKIVSANQASLATMIAMSAPPKPRADGKEPTPSVWATMLSQFDVVIIDEADKFMDALRSAFMETGNFSSVYKATYSHIGRREASDPGAKPFYDLLEKLKDYVDHCCTHYAVGLRVATLDEDTLDMTEKLRDFVRDLTPMIGNAGHDNRAYLKRLKALESFLDAAFFGYPIRINVTEKKKGAFSLGNAKKRSDVDIEAFKPVNKQVVYDSLVGKTLIFTSATLGLDKSFDKFVHELGLGERYREEDTVELNTVFDYPRQAVLFTTEDPALDPRGTWNDEAKKKNYIATLAYEMKELVDITSGYAFLLFCSRAEMIATYKMMWQHLQRNHHEVFFQKQGMRTEKLLRDYTARAHHTLNMGSAGPVLFGLKSFWQGVSVEGLALQLVAVNKLWFPHKDDPHLAAVEQQHGRKSFMLYSIPKCIEQIVQAEGRLIRTPTDRGIFAILDPRLHVTKYGGKIFNSLHTRENAVRNTAELIRRWEGIQQYWAKKEASNG